MPLAELGGHALEIALTVRGRAAQQGAEEALVGVLPAPGPADHGGVSDLVDVFPVGQQVVEGGGVGLSLIHIL